MTTYSYVYNDKRQCRMHTTTIRHVTTSTPPPSTRFDASMVATTNDEQREINGGSRRNASRALGMFFFC